LSVISYSGACCTAYRGNKNGSDVEEEADEGGEKYMLNLPYIMAIMFM
jgi:hypothetical protein